LKLSVGIVVSAMFLVLSVAPGGPTRINVAIVPISRRI
jgi:hypothetical protein